MINNVWVRILVGIFVVSPLLAQAVPVDVNADGVVGPHEVIDLSKSWKGPALQQGGLQPWQINGATIFYNDGLVGIGTSTPDTRLQVNDGRIRLRESATLERWDLFYDPPSEKFYLQENAAFNHLVFTKGPDNRIGIGTDSPGVGTKLHVLNAAGTAILGDSPNGNGVIGASAREGYGATSGVHSGLNGIGVYGQANGSMASGVYGKTNIGYGVYGIADSGYGVYGVTPGGIGVAGRSNINYGVEGTSIDSFGVSGVSTNSIGVSGSGGVAGVDGYSGGGTGVKGSGRNGVTAIGLGIDSNGIVASGDNLAGLFHGSVIVNGNLTENNKSTLQIDHPLDPANKYLSHSSVESSEMKNIYDGNVMLDDNGEAEVALPDWFDALNKDFRYQLTAIGGSGGNLHIARKISDGRFHIGGGSPGLEVSWQVTGIRDDAYAKAHPIEVEKLKKDEERGKYLTPDVFGQPKEMGIYYRPEMEAPSGTVSKVE